MGTALHAPLRSDRLAVRRRVLEQVLLGGLPAVLTGWLALSAIRLHWVAQDFSLAYYPAASRLLHGAPLYTATHAEVFSGSAFVYPPVSALLLAPLALFSSGLADHLYTLLCMALVPGALWVAGVRDWRAYGATLLWFPVIIGWQGENISVPLMFLVALAWRHRERPLVAGLIVAVAISMKPFIWPLGLWLLATRRWRAAASALVCGVALNLIAWALVGFAQIPTYVRLTGEDARALWHGGYSLLALAHHLGVGLAGGYVLLAIAAALLIAATLHRGLRLEDDGAALTFAVALMLIASPLVWIHYFVLLAVPLAVLRPRFDAVWLIPLAMWLLPPATAVNAWQFALAWVLAAASVIAALMARRVRRASADSRPAPPAPSSSHPAAGATARATGAQGPGVRLGYGLSSNGFPADAPVVEPRAPAELPGFGFMADY